MDVNPDPKSAIGVLVAHAPVAYLAFFVLGAMLHYSYPVPLMGEELAHVIGVTLEVVGSLLILFSQASIRKFHKLIELGEPINFSLGPYRFCRNPTYLGVALLLIGVGFLANALAIVVSVLIALFFVGEVFVKREEKLLSEKYGDTYTTYRHKVRRWM